MSKGIVLEALTIVILVAGVGSGAVFATMYLTRDKPTSSSVTSQQQSVEPASYKIVLDVTDKNPVSMQVKQGEFVVFVPEDSSQHRIVSSGSGEHAEDAFDSGVFEASQSYRMQVKDIGTFKLKDTFNPDKKIVIEAR